MYGVFYHSNWSSLYEYSTLHPSFTISYHQSAHSYSPNIIFLPCQTSFTPVGIFINFLETTSLVVLLSASILVSCHIIHGMSKIFPFIVPPHPKESFHSFLSPEALYGHQSDQGFPIAIQ
jgi:cytochrome bd-type quinol oxidase subunit 2